MASGRLWADYQLRKLLTSSLVCGPQLALEEDPGKILYHCHPSQRAGERHPFPIPMCLDPAHCWHFFSMCQCKSALLPLQIPSLGSEGRGSPSTPPQAGGRRTGDPQHSQEPLPQPAGAEKTNPKPAPNLWHSKLNHAYPELISLLEHTVAVGTGSSWDFTGASPPHSREEEVF